MNEAIRIIAEAVTLGGSGDVCRIYERYKRRIQALGLGAEEYTLAIRLLANAIGM